MRTELLILLTILTMYFHHMRYWVSKWMDFDSFYSIGILVLIFIFYFIKDQKDELMKLPKQPSMIGLPIILFSLVLYFVGTKADVKYFSSFSFPLLIAGISLSIYGRKFFLKILPVLAFFTIALPVLPVFRITMPFQLLLAKYTAYFLNFVGLKASYSGSLIILEQRLIDIEAGCSGVTSLYSLFVATFMFIYYKNIKILHKFYLVAASFILSLLGNFTRITLTCLYLLYNGSATYEKFHEILGMVIFVILIICVFTAATILEDNENAEQN